MIIISLPDYMEYLDEPSRLSSTSRNLLWSLKAMLIHHKIDIRTLLLKLFREHKNTLEDHEFERVIRFGDDKVDY